MSRSSVLASTLAFVETIKNPKVQEAWTTLTALLKSSHTFEHFSDLVPPTLLSQQSGAYTLKFNLSVVEADELGMGRENVVDKDKKCQVHYNSRVFIRSCRLQDKEVKVDWFPSDLIARVNDVLYKRQGKEGPIDITSNVKVNPLTSNVINLDVFSSCGIYVITVILVRALNPPTMMKRICDSRTRSLEITKNKIRRYHEDLTSDVAITSTEFSLICPFTRTRINIPAQGEDCNHLSCFDLLTYLMLNVRSGKWLCPICNNKVLPTRLVVDGFWKNVIDRLNEVNDVSSSVLVTVEGDWDPKSVKLEGKLDGVTEISL